jgi:hypothetical protein
VLRQPLLCVTVLPLDEVLRYQNDEVVHRFSSDHSISVADAEEIFLETKRWLWLCASQMAAAPNGIGERIPLLSEARVLDLMWHTFLIFTTDYAAFCEKYFGFFVHHHPRMRAEKEAWTKRIAEDKEGAIAERRAMLRKAYILVADRLGTATLKKWCDDFPSRFP